MSSGSVEESWLVYIKKKGWSDTRQTIREIWTSKQLAEARMEEILSGLGSNKQTTVKIRKIKPLLTITDL